jgi:hypothetical protein
VLALLMAGSAFAMSADRYLATFSYDPYSIRSSPPIQDVQNEAASNKMSASHATTNGGGLDWNYATAWSFSPQEVITFIIPGYYGFGKMPYSGTELNIPEGERIPTYWGQMNGTDAANYTGILVLLMGIMAIVTLWKRDRLVPPLAIISLFALLLSFGGNWPILYRPMFNYFPFFNKFRAPMMALVLMQLAFPILAALSFEEILRVWKLKNAGEDNRLQKYFKFALYISGAFLVISIVLRGAITSGVKSGIEAGIKSGHIQSYMKSLEDFVASTAANDALVCALFATAAAALCFFFVRRKISPLVLGVGIFLLTVIDLWRVDSRPLEIISRDQYQSNFQEHDYIQAIKQDKSLYRVTDLTEQNPSNVLVSYGLQTAGGYHAAKMRKFQDVVDETGNMQGNGIFNPFMFNLLNTKYIVANGGLTNDQTRFTPVYQSKEPPPQQGQPSAIVWENPQALPRAFYAYRYEVKPKLDILHAMHDGTFNPRDVVYFDEAPKSISALATNPIDTTIETLFMKEYKNEEVTMHAKTSGNRLVFMSDSWYPDWNVTIDGKPTPLYRANYAFRAFVVPQGDHEVKLTYYDPKYATGRSISLLMNALALVGFGVGITSFSYARRKRRPEVEVVPPESV